MQNYPFSALVGQPLLKRALLLAAVDPLINGVLIAGPRGVAKSTTARAFFDVLPVVQQPSAFVHLPLGSSEDMLTGSLDLEQVLQDKQVVFKEGLLAKAHQGVLYVDEVNLLADNLVDLLLDVSASGVNRLERDGVSHQHDSRFLLIGTMNPEEGELRPQLLDRFGFMVNLASPICIDERINIVERREAFESAPDAFCASFMDAQQQLTESIAQAQRLLPRVSMSQAIKRQIAETCVDAGVEGLRADIVLHRAAKACAALDARTEVLAADLLAVRELVLTHRRQSTQNQTPPNQPPPPQQFKRPEPPLAQQDKQEAAGEFGEMRALTNVPISSRQLVGKPFSASKNKTTCQGGSIKQVSTQTQTTNSPDWFKSLSGGKGELTLASIRFKQKPQQANPGHCVLLDTSASTLNDQHMSLMKKCVLTIQQQAYRAREHFCLYGFGNGKTEALIPLSRATHDVTHLINDIGAGGGTPLREMLESLSQQLKTWTETSALSMTTYLITDGRTQQSVEGLRLTGKVVVIDAEMGAIKRGRCQQIAQQLQADYDHLHAWVAA